MLVLILIAALVVPATASSSPPAHAAATACRPLNADFFPSRGNPQRLRVRFTVSRFVSNRPVYLHYIGPNHHLKRSVRLGTASGRCGFMRTGYRRLFPFTASPGTWRLRFTNSATYRVRPTPPYVTLAVNVLRARR